MSQAQSTQSTLIRVICENKNLGIAGRSGHVGCVWHWLKMQFSYYSTNFYYYSAYFLLLFMSLITFFGTIYESHSTNSASF